MLPPALDHSNLTVTMRSGSMGNVTEMGRAAFLRFLFFRVAHELLLFKAAKPESGCFISKVF